MRPLVSVVVTTYNQRDWIASTLDSVLAQTLDDVEVIVVDDGSTDDTADRVAPFRDLITYVRQANRGVAAARNAGVRQARGELVAFLDGDDLWAPDKLAAQVAAARRTPRAGLIVADGVKFSGDRVLSVSLLGRAIEHFTPLGVDGVATGRCWAPLLEGNFISTTSQVVIPARVLAAVGLSDETLPLCSDYDLYLRIAARHDVTIVARPLTRWRYLRSSASGPEELRDLRWGAEAIAIIKKQQRLGPTEHRPLVSAVLRRRLFAIAQTAYYYGRQSDRRWASRYLLRLLARNPGASAIPLFLAGLWCPQAVASALGPRVRKAGGAAGRSA